MHGPQNKGPAGSIKNQVISLRYFLDENTLHMLHFIVKTEANAQEISFTCGSTYVSKT